MTIENNSHFERFLAVPWDVVRFKVGTLDVSHQPHTFFMPQVFTTSNRRATGGRSFTAYLLMENVES
jgi:hypothetical protein